MKYTKETRNNLNNICKDILSKVEAGETWPWGICLLVEDEINLRLGINSWDTEEYELMESLFNTWGFYSGDADFPVPSSIWGGSPAKQYISGSDEDILWKGRQLEYRVSLLKHIIKETESK